jgi:hypothetical protein
MKNTKPDSVFTKTGSSFACKRKGQPWSMSFDRTGPAKTNTGCLAQGIKVHAKPILFNVNVPNLNARLDGLPVFVPNRGIDGSNDFGLAAHNLSQKPRIGFEEAGELFGCEMEDGKVGHTSGEGNRKTFTSGLASLKGKRQGGR